MVTEVEWVLMEGDIVLVSLSFLVSFRKKKRGGSGTPRFQTSKLTHTLSPFLSDARFLQPTLG